MTKDLIEDLSINRLYYFPMFPILKYDMHFGSLSILRRMFFVARLENGEMSFSRNEFFLVFANYIS